MSDTAHTAKVTAWHLEMTGKLDALRTRWAQDAQARAAQPPVVRRNDTSPRGRRAAGPPDAAQLAREAEQARLLAQARESWLISMERTALDIVMMTEG